MDKYRILEDNNMFYVQIQKESKGKWKTILNRLVVGKRPYRNALDPRFYWDKPFESAPAAYKEHELAMIHYNMCIKPIDLQYEYVIGNDRARVIMHDDIYIVQYYCINGNYHINQWITLEHDGVSDTERPLSTFRNRSYDGRYIHKRAALEHYNFLLEQEDPGKVKLEAWELPVQQWVDTVMYRHGRTRLVRRDGLHGEQVLRRFYKVQGKLPLINRWYILGKRYHDFSNRRKMGESVYRANEEDLALHHYRLRAFGSLQGKVLLEGNAEP